MYPIHDVDVLLLMAAALASKRRPADLVEIVSAADLIHGSIPHVSDLAEAFSRLSCAGLLVAAEGGFTLTLAGQGVMAGRRKAETAERILVIREKLAAYVPAGDHAPIRLTAAQLSAAIVALRTAVKGTGGNLLMPKAKTATERDYKRPGTWRKFSASRRRKD